MKANLNKKLFIWCIGLVILIITSTVVLNSLNERAQTTYNPTSFFWVRFVLYSLIGSTIGLIMLILRISKNRFLSLFTLIIAIICIGIALIQPSVATFDSINSNNKLSLSLIELSNVGWITILGGFLLTTSIIFRQLDK